MAKTTGEFQAQTVIDAVFDFANGINSGIAPLKLAKTQLAFGTNGTVRGTFYRPRPPLQKITLNFENAATQENFEKFLFQAACHYKPDTGGESLMAAVAGRLFKLLIGASSATVTDETIPGTAIGAAGPNPPDRPQAWIWQAEKWIIWTDGISKPVFFDQTASPTSRRSLYQSHIPFTDTISADFTVPAVGAAVAGGITLTDGNTSLGTRVAVGDIITIRYAGQYIVTALTSLTNFAVTYMTYGAPPGTQVKGATLVPASWYHLGTELPPGRMGTYGLGRNWLSLVDGKQFLASDLVGGSSGTVANNFRDAALQITENTYLSGGGNFTVPGSIGDIRAMRFATTLDKSLGQGALQVFTPTVVFSCDAPTDRSTWQTVTNPIVTESLIGNGGLGQNSTIGWNGDTIFRSVDGMRSLILARRDFDTWGNVPISREVERPIDDDDDTLLAYGSAITFDNRLLMTCVPKASTQGVFHQAIIALNADPNSSLAGKSASVYDGIWTGLNVLQLVKGQFSEVERAFAFGLNTTLNKIELYEILKSKAGKFDNGNVRIRWDAETAALLYNVKGKGPFDFCQLIDGEMSVDSVVGQVDFEVFYKPDSYPCWIPWRKWSVCSKRVDPDQPVTANYQPGFYPRMGFGEPDPKLCDGFTSRPFREAYFFELKFVITGYCRILGAKIKAVTIPQPDFAPVCCNPT